MKVSDIMQKSVITVSEESLLKEVARLIFSLGIGGVPVVHGRKLVGIVTEEDILSQLYPTMKDLIEDYSHSRDFEAMEKNLLYFINVPIKKIMNKIVVSISADTPLMRAQSIMLLNKFSRLPVVDGKKNLIGLVSQGDIFRQLLRNEIPQIEREQYAGFISRHYDLMVDWGKRFKYEFPTLFKILKKEKIKKVLDIGTWTGEYTVALVKHGVKTLGLDHNPVMIKISNEKKDKLPVFLKKNVTFMLTDFTDIARKIKEKFDAAIFMGNALPYIPVPISKIFKDLSLVLREKNPILIIQLLNFDKFLITRDRLLSFKIHKSNLAYEKEHLFLEFFDKKTDNILLHNVIIFDSDGKNWVYKGKTTIPIHYISKNDLQKTLKETGFNKISFSGSKGNSPGEYGKFSLTEPFQPLESDWLNVVARR